MTKIHDLRSALEFLETVPGQLLTSDTEVDPNAEVSGVYRHVGAGGTVARPTKEGPASSGVLVGAGTSVRRSKSGSVA